jgi:superfamily I DNA/RNA helicase
VDLVDSYGEETIIAVVDRLAAEDHARVTVSTAHKAKGREWDSVRIGPGFRPRHPDAANPAEEAPPTMIHAPFMNEC